MKLAQWAVFLLAACAMPAAAQISIPLPGTGGSIQINPQQPDQRYQDPNRSYGGGMAICVLGAVYGRNCRGQYGANVTDDLIRQCQGRDYCVYRIDYRQIGDPSPNCGKDYHARYICRDGDAERYVGGRRGVGPIGHPDCRRR